MIRAAQLRDIDTILEMMRRFHAAHGLDLFPANDQHARRLVERYMGDPNHLVLIMTAGDDGSPVGLLMACAGPYDFAPVRIATERLWWIDSPHRGRVEARQMVAQYEQWARGLGCQVATMSALCSNPVAGVFYERRGYVAGDMTYLKRL